MSDYVSKAVTTKIGVVSRVALNINENYYTVEYKEEREIPDVDGIDMDMERKILFDEANTVVDAQAADILATFNKKKGK